MTATANTVYIVDDDPDIRSSLSRALNLHGFHVVTYESGALFLGSFDGSVPGCLVLDQGMPGMSGLELQAHLNAEGHSIPIIFITGHGGVPESVQAMKGGAIDFLEKPFSQTALVERIHAALEIASQKMQASQASREVNARLERLTPREREIVDHMVANPSEITSKEVARYLGISPRTVDHHRARILEKLAISSLVELIAFAKKSDP